MKLISWNLKGSNRDRFTPIVPEQAEALLGAEPDIVAFQEVHRRRVPEWREAFARDAERSGHHWHIEHNLDFANAPRINFGLTASRWPIIEVEQPEAIKVPHPERVLAVTIEAQDQRLQVINTHVLDGSSYEWGKIEHLEALYSYLTDPGRIEGVPRILCGDFNEPQSVREDGYIITWGQKADGGFNDPDRRWDTGVRNVLVGLQDYDLADVYASLVVGRRVDDSSWVARGGRGGRYDHILASAALDPQACGYLHDWRTSGLSDHSGIWASFNWPT